MASVMIEVDGGILYYLFFSYRLFYTVRCYITGRRAFFMCNNIFLLSIILTQRASWSPVVHYAPYESISVAYPL